MTSVWFYLKTSCPLDRPRRLELFDLLGAVAERGQYFVGMFTEIGCGRPDLAVEARDLAGLRHQIEFAEARMPHGSLDAQRLDLRVGERLLDVVDRPARQACCHQ